MLSIYSAQKGSYAQAYTDMRLDGSQDIQQHCLWSSKRKPQKAAAQRDTRHKTAIHAGDVAFSKAQPLSQTPFIICQRYRQSGTRLLTFAGTPRSVTLTATAVPSHVA